MHQEVEKAIEQRMPKNRAFEVIAEKTGLKINTIRNYYYRYTRDQENDKEANTEGMSGFRKSYIGRNFTNEEVDNLIANMLIAQAQGRSVRGCANSLSGGDPKLLIRLQNKYRNTIAGKPDYVNKLMAEMEQKGIKFYNPYTNEYVNTDNKSDIMLMESIERKDILTILSNIAENMQKIQNVSLYQFFKGICDLSQMAVNNISNVTISNQNEIPDRKTTERMGRMEEDIKSKDRMIVELNNKVLVYETRLEEQRHRSNRLISLFRQLITINREFIGLSDVNKLTKLSDYISKIESCIEDYKSAMDE